MGGLARTELCSLRSTKWVTHMPPQSMPIGNAMAQRPRPRQFQDAQESLSRETLAGWHQLETAGSRRTSANIHTSSRNALSSMILAQDVGGPIPRDVAPVRGGPRRLGGGYVGSAASLRLPISARGVITAAIQGVSTRQRAKRPMTAAMHIWSGAGSSPLARISSVGERHPRGPECAPRRRWTGSTRTGVRRQFQPSIRGELAV